MKREGRGFIPSEYQIARRLKKSLLNEMNELSGELVWLKIEAKVRIRIIHEPKSKLIFDSKFIK